MTFDQRKKLEAAAVASFIENIENGDSDGFYADFAEKALRYGYLGFAQMYDAELLETVKKDIGYDPDEAYAEDVDCSTEKLGALGRAIREVENS